MSQRPVQPACGVVVRGALVPKRLDSPLRCEVEEVVLCRRLVAHLALWPASIRAAAAMCACAPLLSRFHSLYFFHHGAGGWRICPPWGVSPSIVYSSAVAPHRCVSSNHAVSAEKAGWAVRGYAARAHAGSAIDKQSASGQQANVPRQRSLPRTPGCARAAGLENYRLGTRLAVVSAVGWTAMSREWNARLCRERKDAQVNRFVSRFRHNSVKLSKNSLPRVCHGIGFIFPPSPARTGEFLHDVRRRARCLVRTGAAPFMLGHGEHLGVDRFPRSPVRGCGSGAPRPVRAGP